jgi:hypothetical protein
MAKYKQGVFRPKHPEKYKGNITKNPPVYRSGWELSVMSKLDLHPDVLEWGSEGVVVSYLSPKDNKYHRYFIDFYIKCKTKDGNIRVLIVEVKPSKQCVPPVLKKGMHKKRYITEVITYGVNQAKWASAQKLAAAKNWEFQVWTEKDIGAL